MSSLSSVVAGPAILVTFVLAPFAGPASASPPAHTTSRQVAAEPPPSLASEPAPAGPALARPIPANPTNRLVLEGGGLELPVGYYGDCTRATEVGHDGAYIDGCIPRPVAYFIGHNPGPFTPMAGVAVGQVIDYYDGSARLHRLQIVSARRWDRFWGAPPPSQGDVVAQFQTCVTLDAVWDRILDAVEIPSPPAPAPVSVPLAEYRAAG